MSSRSRRRSEGTLCSHFLLNLENEKKKGHRQFPFAHFGKKQKPRRNSDFSRRNLSTGISSRNHDAEEPTSDARCQFSRALNLLFSQTRTNVRFQSIRAIVTIDQASSFSRQTRRAMKALIGVPTGKRKAFFSTAKISRAVKQHPRASTIASGEHTRTHTFNNETNSSSESF